MSIHDDFHEDFKQMRRGMLRSFGPMAVFAIIVNLALLAGAVWVVVWVLRATGVMS